MSSRAPTTQNELLAPVYSHLDPGAKEQQRFVRVIARADTHLLGYRRVQQAGRPIPRLYIRVGELERLITRNAAAALRYPEALSSPRQISGSARFGAVTAPLCRSDFGGIFGRILRDVETHPGLVIPAHAPTED